MPRDFLKDAKDEYDVVVIGSGLAGLTSANVLARAGRSVLLLEQHYKLGGMATWFKRPGGHIFDIIGSITSGIAMANGHCLRGDTVH